MTGVRFDKRAVTALLRLPEVEERVRLVAARIDEEASALAPRDTGRLASQPGIVVEETTDDEGVLECHVTWAPEAFYGRFLEFGTEDTPPRPHLRPAARKVGGS